MAGGIYKALNIESGEEGSVMLLIFQSVFIGIFYGAFDISAHALFLEEYPASMIPKAYIVSGVAGILMTSAYSFLQSRMRFNIFALINLVLIAGVTALLRYGFLLTSREVIVFIIFVMMGPLNILALLGFWGTTGRIFTLRQGKRLFGLIDTGQIVGIIIASYAIPILLSFEFETSDLLLLSAGSIIVAVLFQVIISARIPFKAEPTEADGSKVKEDSFFRTFRDRYVLTMSGFVTLLVIVVFFVHFTFISVAKDYYPDHGAFAAFLGYFNGTLMIFSVIIKTFVYGAIMKTYGLRLALAITPILLAVFTVVAAIVGGFFGYSVAAASFTLFFLLLSVSKLFNKALQDSIVAPSMKILYQSLDARIRYSVQARIDGTINEIAALTAGVVLAGLGALAFFEIIHYVYVLAGFLALWVVVALRLYTAYKRSLNESLVKFRESGAQVEEKQPAEYIEEKLEQGSPAQIINAVKITEFISFRRFTNALVDLIGNTSRQVRNYALKKIRELTLLDQRQEIEQTLKAEKSPENQELTRVILSSLDHKKLKSIKDDELPNMVKSMDADVRISIARYLYEAPEFRYLPVLNTLLRDHDMDVRKSAIDVAVKWKVRETVPVLIDYLDSPLYDRAFDALVSLGESALEGIEQAYFKTGIDEEVLARLARIKGLIGTEQAQELLLDKISHHNKEVALQALQSLTISNYQAAPGQVSRIAQTIRSIISVLAWNLAAEHTVEEHDLGAHLKKAFKEEISSNFDQMYNLLAIAYDPVSIYHIRQNLESGTSEGIGFAIELLDLFVAEELKPVLFPVLDDTTVVQKIRDLQVEFPVVILEPEELLTSIINRDPNYVYTYTKACALYELDKVPGIKFSQDLAAQVFNPDILLAELAAWQSGKLDKDAYESLLTRLDTAYRNPLNEKLAAIDSGRSELYIEMIFRLEQVPHFASLTGDLLLRVARHIMDEMLSPGQEIVFEPDKEKHLLVYVAEGSLTLSKQNTELAKAGRGEMISSLPYLAVEGGGFRLKALEESRIYSLDLATVRKYMFDHNEFAVAIYNWMNEQVTREEEFLKKIEMVS